MSFRAGYSLFIDTTPRSLQCLVCHKDVRDTAFARSSHGKKHVREGDARAVGGSDFALTEQGAAKAEAKRAHTRGEDL